MQMQPVPQQPGRPALRSGVVVGIALGLIYSFVTIIPQVSNPQPGVLNPLSSTTITLDLIMFLAWIIGFLFAGAWGSKTTGKIGTGTLSGLFAGIFGGLLASIGEIISIVIALNMQSYRFNGLDAGTSSLLLFTGVATIIYILALAIGGGTGLGAMGGLIGQSLSKVRPQPHVSQPQPYPAVPYYSYPSQPPLTPQPVQQPQPPSENIVP